MSTCQSLSQFFHLLLETVPPLFSPLPPSPPPPPCLPPQARPNSLRARGYRFAGVIEVGGAFTMRWGSGCLDCIFQRANRYRLRLSPSKLFIHTDKQGKKGDVRSRGRRRRVWVTWELSFVPFFSLPHLSLLSSLDSLLGLRVKHGRGRRRWGGKEKRGSEQEGERQEKKKGREERKGKIDETIRKKLQRIKNPKIIQR